MSGNTGHPFAIGGPQIRVKVRRHQTSIGDRLQRQLIRGKPGECWEWQGARNNKGYGVVGAGDRAAGTVLAHRATWELHHGPIPDGLKVLHCCDNPSCCNPAHLWLGTQADNMRDCVVKGRLRAPRLFGSSNPATKLSDTDVWSIAKRLERGESAASIARSVGIGASTVLRIKTRKRTYGARLLRINQPMQATALDER